MKLKVDFKYWNIRTVVKLIKKKMESTIDTYNMLLMLLLPAVIFFVMLSHWFFKNQHDNK